MKRAKAVEQIKHFKNVLINERSGSEIYQNIFLKKNLEAFFNRRNYKS